MAPKIQMTSLCYLLLFPSFFLALHPFSGRSRKQDRCQREHLYPLVESEPCPCEEFVSQPYGNWSSCILSETPAQGSLQGWRGRREARDCGHGLCYRAVACLDHEAHLVSPDLCSESGSSTHFHLLSLAFSLSVKSQVIFPPLGRQAVISQIGSCGVPWTVSVN